MIKGARSIPALGRIFIVFVILLIVAFGSSHATGEEAYIAVKPAAVFRETPSLKAKILDRIAFGTRVDVIDRDGPPLSTLGVAGHWVRIKTGEKHGWIFAPLLTAKKGAGTLLSFGNLVIPERRLAEFDKERAALPDCGDVVPRPFPAVFRSGSTEDGISLEADGTIWAQSNHSGMRGVWKKRGSMIVAYGGGGPTDSLDESCGYGHPAGDACKKKFPNDEAKAQACCVKRLRTQRLREYGKLELSYNFIYFYKMHKGRFYEARFINDATPIPGKKLYRKEWRPFAPSCLYPGTRPTFEPG